jgi:hypothetical protein
VERQPLLVGFHGVKRSGKDTAASFLEEWARGRSFSVARHGFADYAKWAFARQFYPAITMPDAIAWVDEHKDKGRRIAFPSYLPKNSFDTVDFRQCVAQFATEGARLIYGDDHWVDLLLPEERWGFPATWWDNFMDGNRSADFCAITDMRFDNELARIRKLGGVNVKIRRTPAEEAVLAQTSIHESELGIPDQEFDYVVPNDGTLDDLKLLIDSLAATLMQERV